MGCGDECTSGTQNDRGRSAMVIRRVPFLSCGVVERRMDEKKLKEETARHTTPVDMALFEGVFDGFVEKHAEEHEGLAATQKSTELDLARLSERIEELEAKGQHRADVTSALAAILVLVIRALAKNHPRLVETIADMTISYRGKPLTKAEEIKGALVNMTKLRRAK